MVVPMPMLPLLRTKKREVLPVMKLIEPLNAPPGETRAMLLMRYSWVLLLKP